MLFAAKIGKIVTNEKLKVPTISYEDNLDCINFWVKMGLGNAAGLYINSSIMSEEEMIT